MFRFLIALLFAGNAALAQHRTDTQQMRQLALEQVNASRAQQGLDALSVGTELNQAARNHAEDMLKRGYYAHVSPDGSGPRDRYLAAGGNEWEVVAENIARCTGCPIPPTLDRVEAFHTGWMNSPEHRKNILQPGLARFGFALVAGQDTIYAVQTFAGPGSSRGEQSTPVESTDATAIALEPINDARTQAGLPNLSASSTLTEGAADLLPQDLSGFELGDMGSLSDVAGNWRRLSAVAAACGGCGGQVVKGDVTEFVSDWLTEGNVNRSTLLDPNITQIGMTVRSDGQGRKIAILLLGQGL